MLLATASGFWLLKVLWPPDRTLVAGDIYSYFYPMLEEGFSSLRSGAWPLWNPYQLCGLPLLATIQPGFFYPLNALHLVLPTGDALAIGAFLHLFLAGAFMYAYVRSLGLGSVAGLVGALVWTYALAPINILLQPNWYSAQIWIPLILLAADHVIRAPSSRGVAGLGAALAMPLLAGAPQLALHCGYALGLYVSVRLFQHYVRGRRPGATLQVALLLGVGVVFSLSLSAVQLLPTLELAGESTRSLEGLTLEASQFYGAPDLWILGRGLVAPLVDRRDTFYLAYFGLVPLALAVASLFSRRRLAVRAVFLILAITTFTLASGVSGPLYEVFFNLPTGSWFRAPTRFLHLFVFAAAALTAFGTEHVTGWVPAPTRQKGGGWSRMPAVAVAVLLTLIGLDLFRAYELLGANRRIANPVKAAAEIDSSARDFAIVRQRTGLDRVYVLNLKQGLDRVLRSKWGTLSHLFVAQDYEPMAPRRYADFFSYAEGGTLTPAGRQWQGEYPVLPSLTHPKLLALASIRYLLADRPLEQSIGISSMLRLGYRRVRDLPYGWPPRLLLYENPRALPRAYVAKRSRLLAPSVETLSYLGDERFHPETEVLLESSSQADERYPIPSFNGVGSAPSEVGDRAEIVSLESTEVTIRAETESGGFLVLTDLHYPGWLAEVDGHPARILRANYLFRAVKLAPGAHTVVYRYEPASFRRGGLISLVALLALLLAVAWPAYRGSGS